MKNILTEANRLAFGSDESVIEEVHSQSLPVGDRDEEDEDEEEEEKVDESKKPKKTKTCKCGLTDDDNEVLEDGRIMVRTGHMQMDKFLNPLDAEEVGRIFSGMQDENKLKVKQAAASL